MKTYSTPGVYFEWLDPPAQIGVRRTDIAGFVGVAPRGPLHTPCRLTSWTQFVSTFGPHVDQAFLAYAVEGFFANGGQTCWAVRVADPDWAAAARLELRDGVGTMVLELTATSPGVWGREVTVQVLHGGTGRFSMLVRGPGGEQELWRDLSLIKGAPRYAPDVLNRDDNTGSRLLHLAVPAGLGPHTRPPAGVWRLDGGQDGLAPAIDLRDRTGQPTLRVIATAPGAEGDNLTITVTAEPNDLFGLTVEAPDGRRESWTGLTMKRPTGKPPVGSPVPRDVEEMINHQLTGSRLIAVRDLGSPATWPANAPDPAAANLHDGAARLTGGLRPAHFSGDGAPLGTRWGLATLETVDEISIVAMPDIMPRPFTAAPPLTPAPLHCDRLPPLGRDRLDAEMEPPPPRDAPRELAPAFGSVTLRELQRELIAHCERLKDRVVILDPTSALVAPRAMLDDRRQFDSAYAALYYPWLRVPNRAQRDGPLLWAVPPSGHVAGIYAREDLRIGVHKPPANVLVELAQDVTTVVDDVTHGLLNDADVNAIRPYPGRGVRVAGARTLSSDPEWRYVNVRRLVTMIEEAIDEETQWTVFEPNSPQLWLDVDRVIRDFLDRIWRRGMLDGATAAEAFYVTCDAATNPPSGTERGRLVCEIGLQPPWPAEFVVVRIGKTAAGVEVIEERPGRNG